jgi:hypothetical protein
VGSPAYPLLVCAVLRNEYLQSQHGEFVVDMHIFKRPPLEPSTRLGELALAALFPRNGTGRTVRG